MDNKKRLAVVGVSLWVVASALLFYGRRERPFIRMERRPGRHRALKPAELRPAEAALEPPRRVLSRVPGQGSYTPSLGVRKDPFSVRRPMKAGAPSGSEVLQESAPAGGSSLAASAQQAAGSKAAASSGGKTAPAAPAAQSPKPSLAASPAKPPAKPAGAPGPVSWPKDAGAAALPAEAPRPTEAVRPEAESRSSGSETPSGGGPGSASATLGAKAPGAPRVGASGPVEAGGGGSSSGGAGAGSSGGGSSSLGGERGSSDADFAASLNAGRAGLTPGSVEGGAVQGTGAALQQAAPVVEPVRAAEGEVAPEKAKQTNGLFSSDKGGQPNVKVYRLETSGPTQPVAFTSDMDIDADGAGGAWKGDRTGQSQTSLKYSNGESLNPSQLPFVVIPLDFPKQFPDVGLGDYSAVSYKGKTVYGIIGDYGPRGVVGEASISMAASLGINPDPNKGGTSGGVNYVLFPKTRDPEPPRDAQAIQQRGAQILQEHGLGLK